jgi:hypothetical protein
VYVTQLTLRKFRSTFVASSAVIRLPKRTSRLRCQQAAAIETGRLE